MREFDEQLKRIRDFGDTELIDAVVTGKMSVKSAALIADCRVLANAGNRVEAVKKYRSETGASLKVAQQALWGN